MHSARNVCADARACCHIVCSRELVAIVHVVFSIGCAAACEDGCALKYGGAARDNSSCAPLHFFPRSLLTEDGDADKGGYPHGG
mmetsp:Transcript_33672/g.96686  ORF Transcript_33672/g.96686 Transcript_33672/m.96686 type:complete len:84 (+) Transcript_33672:115-366(+)